MNKLIDCFLFLVFYFFLNYFMLVILDNIDFGGFCFLLVVFLLLYGVFGYFKSICYIFVIF